MPFGRNWIFRALLIALGSLGPTATVRAQMEAMPITVLDDRIERPVTMRPVAAAGIMQDPIRDDDGPTVADDPGPPLSDPTGGAPPGSNWSGPYSFQLLPDGLMYKNYLAGKQEPRFASQWVRDKTVGWFWDIALGGHVGLMRYGTQDALFPEGVQLDIDGAAFPRLDDARNMVSTDFRFGIPLTLREDAWEWKFGYYHLSSHLGDLYMVNHPDAVRINYVREALVLGLAYRLIPDLRLYGEANWAFHTDGGAKPWEFQFGLDYSAAQPTSLWGSPFVGLNGAIRQDVHYSGNFTAEAGWQWRGATGRLFRVGAQYFTGMSEQRQFYQNYEEYVGAGIWYDY